MRKSIVTIAIFCCGCAQTSQQESALEAIRHDMRLLQNRMSQTNTQIAALRSVGVAAETAIGDQIVDLQGVLGELDETVRTTCTLPTKPTNVSCEEVTRRIVVATDNKMVLGEVERVWVDPPGLSMIARMDTGASSSSLHADNITSFERDGEDWVRFDIGSEDATVTIERPVEKFVRVFQQADRSGSRRPVVALRLFLGDVKDIFTFTLADRSHLQHDMILGRNFLTDMALVDVSQQFVQPTHPPEDQ